MDQAGGTPSAPGGGTSLKDSNGVKKEASKARESMNTPTPAASAAPKPKPVEDDEDDDVPIGKLVKTPTTTAKPAATTPKPAANTAKLAANTPKPPTTPKPTTSTPLKPTPSTAKTPLSGVKEVEKTTDTKDVKTTTATGIKNTTTTTTTTKTTTPGATKTKTVTDTLTTSTPKKAAVKKEEDSDDDKPLSSLAHEKKTVVVKTEKKGGAVVTKEKTTVVKRDVKEEKKDDKKPAPKRAPAAKRKVESDSGESESESDESSSEEEKRPKKTPTKKKKKPVESESEDSNSDSDSDDEPKKKGAKKKKKGEDEEKPKKRGKKDTEDEDEWKWWLEDALPDGKKWSSLVHNGVMFAEPYVPHKVKFYYDGKAVDLSPAAEEVATFYAKYLETEYPKKSNFNTNFWGEFKTYLTSDQKKIVKDFAKADFTHIHKYLVEQKEQKALKTTEQKKAEKEEKEKLLQKYGYAMVSGHRQRISNWAIERPGLFLGRGAHPKTGLVKKRIVAEDVTINIGKGVPVPEPPPGHKWSKVVHDDKVAWLAMWKENINNGFKYVWLHASSATKGRSDMKKFEVARKLKDLIDKIRKQYTKELESDELEIRQRSTALYLIDKLALRVGNEKDESETADTVGCCSLRVEHVTLKEPASLTLDFLGKDSMRYLNTVDVDKLVFKNIQEFMHKGGNKKTPKKPDSDLFDQLTPTTLNKYLKEFMPNLSAKVFRTFNASLTLEKELLKMPASIKDATNDEKIAGFEKKKAKLQQQILFLKGKGKKPEWSDSESEEEPTKKATPKKAAEKKTTKKEKGDDDDFATTPTKKRKKGEEDDFQDTPTKKAKRALPDDIEKCKSQIERVEASIKKWNVKKTEKDELKSVALTTSKINYIDPRITAAWAKKVSLPMEKLFSKSLRDKFPWAMEVDAKWKF